MRKNHNKIVCIKLVHLPYLITLSLSGIVIIIIITFMSGVYNYVPETNRVYKVYNVAVLLQLHYMAHVMLFATLNVLYCYISTSRSICTVHSMAVLYSSLLSCFPVRCSGTV